jgi:23S rRNA (cytosine1962-C5)-methyltransferase
VENRRYKKSLPPWKVFQEMRTYAKLKPEIKPKHFVTPEKAANHADLLANRVAKRFRHLSRIFRRQGIECFRLYDWDIPEVRAVVDWYAGHAVVAEYVRLQTGGDWLPRMAQAVGEALHVPPQKIHIKRRRTNTKAGPRYRRMGSKGERFEVRERDLRFRVNLDDFLDTGLYSDHRDTRMLVRGLAAGTDFLNLYGYTGAFTCAAAAGGAKTTVTVDRCAAYIEWAKENLKLNGLWGPRHALVQSDVFRYLEEVRRRGRKFTLAFVDPPSFFRERREGASFDIDRDHPELLKKVLQVMAPGATLIFSTNHQRFTPRFEDLGVKEIIELTPATIPQDYRNRRVHRCWRMTVS